MERGEEGKEWTRKRWGGGKGRNRERADWMKRMGKTGEGEEWGGEKIGRWRGQE